jgi:hypothetical protein
VLTTARVVETLEAVMPVPVVPVTEYVEAATLTTDGTDMKLDSNTLSTDKTTLDCSATYTDATVNTDARETVVKTGMATAQQGISAKTAAVVSVLATAKMVAGSLSTVASVGAAIAALSMSF